MKLTDRLYIFVGKCGTFFSKSIFLLFSVFFTICIFVSFVTNSVSKPSPIFIPNNLVFIGAMLICIGITIGILFFLYKLNNKLSHISLIKFQIIILSIYIIVQVAFVLFFPISARGDSIKVINASLELLKGDTSSLNPGNYLSFYPNNIGITLFLSATYYFFPYSLLVPRFINIILTTLTVIYSARLLIQLTNSNERMYRYALMILALAPVPIIMNNFIYGDVPSTCFCIIGLYYGVKFHKKRKISLLIPSAICLMLGYFLRCSGAFFIVALLLYYIVHAFWDKTFFKKGFIGVLIMIILCFNLPYLAFDYIGNQTGFLNYSINSHSQPLIRWINMGYPTKEDLGYWDKGHATQVFHNVCKDDKKAAEKILTAEFMKKVKDTPTKDTFIGYLKKTFWLWTEGTYQSNFYTLTAPNKPQYKMLYNTPFKNQLKDSHSNLRIGLIGVLHSQNLLLLALLVLMSIYSFIKKRYEMLLPSLVIFIFFVFYIIWEIKSRYIYGSYFMLILIGIVTLDHIFRKLRRKNYALTRSEITS